MTEKRDVELGKVSLDTANGYHSKRTEKQAPVELGADYDSASDSDDGLPITANRHARWWYAIFHNVTAMVGAGVLGLPQAFKYLGSRWFASLHLFSECFCQFDSGSSGYTTFVQDGRQAPLLSLFHSLYLYGTFGSCAACMK